MARARKIADAYVEISARQQRLDGDLNTARGKVTRFVRQQRTMVGGMFSGVSRSLSTIGAGLLGGLGIGAGVAAFVGIEHALSSIVEAGISAEESENKLRATLRSTGNEVDANAARINAMADSLRDTANVDDDVTRSLVSFGLNLGISTDKINEMTQAALGLAEATGDDAESSMTKLVKANTGSFMALQKQLPVLKSMKTAEEKLAYVQKIADQGMEQRRAKLNTLGGSTTQLKLATHELAETFGGLLAPSLTSATKKLTEYVNFLRMAQGEAGRLSHFAANQPLRDQINANNQSSLAMLDKLIAKRKAAADANYNSQRSGNYWNSPQSAMAQVYARGQDGKRGRIGGETPAEEFRRLGDRIKQLDHGEYTSAGEQRAIDAARKRRKELETTIVGEGSPTAGRLQDAKERDVLRTREQNNQARESARREKETMGTFIEQQLQAAGGGDGWAAQIVKQSGAFIFDRIDNALENKINQNNANSQRRVEGMNDAARPAIDAERLAAKENESRISDDRQRMVGEKLSSILGKLDLSIPKLIAALNREAKYSK
jgi:hypothetical protein